MTTIRRTWTCRACGKVSYRSRAEARQAANAERRAKMRVHRCNRGADAWHLTSISVQATVNIRRYGYRPEWAAPRNPPHGDPT